jgi:hypothetical protein
MPAGMRIAGFISTFGISTHSCVANYRDQDRAAIEVSTHRLGRKSLGNSSQGTIDTHSWLPVSQAAAAKFDALTPERSHWTTRPLMQAAMAAGFIAATTIVSAEVRAAPAQQSTRQAYEACLSLEATKGTYTASDGGISALLLMDQCKPQLGEWRLDCMASGQTVNQCNLLAASYAQAALEQREP